MGQDMPVVLIVTIPWTLALVVESWVRRRHGVRCRASYVVLDASAENHYATARCTTQVDGKF